MIRHLSDLWQQLELAPELESDLHNIVESGWKRHFDFNAGKSTGTASKKIGVLIRAMKFLSPEVAQHL